MYKCEYCEDDGWIGDGRTPCPKCNSNDKECHINMKNELLKAEFIGVFQYSKVIEPSPMVGGHKGGVVAFPVAVIKLEGKLKEVKLSDITFKC